MAGPITYGDPSKYNIGVSGGGYVPPGPLPGYGPPPASSGTQTHDSQHAISNMSHGVTPSGTPSGTVNPYQTSAGGTYYGQHTPGYTGDENTDLTNLTNNYPGYHSVFSGFDANGNPTGVNSMFQMKDPTHVTAGDDFKHAQDSVQNLSDVVYTHDANGKITGYNTSDSPLASGQLSQLATGYQNNVDQTNKDVDNSTAQGLSQLAMTGGLSSGARTRLAQNGQATGINAQQSGANQYLQGQQSIRTNDANYKANIQQNLPGMQQSLDAYTTGLGKYNTTNDVNADQFNTGIRTGDFSGMNGYDTTKYGFMGDVIGNHYNSNAMGGAGGAGPGGGPNNGQSTGVVTDAMTKQWGAPVSNGIMAVPGAGTFGTIGNNFGNWAGGDFGEKDNRYEDLIPGVTTYKYFTGG